MNNIPTREEQEKVGEVFISHMEKGGRFTQELMEKYCLENVKDVSEEHIVMISDALWSRLLIVGMIKQIDGTEFYRKLSDSEYRQAVELARQSLKDDGVI